MTDDGLPKRRNSLRYPGHDYSQPGCLFVTLCTHHRQRLFSAVVDGEVVLSEIGTCAADMWRKLPNRFPSVIIDTLVVMPDHLHGILVMGTNPLIAPGQAPKLGKIIASYKEMVRTEYSRQVRAGRWPRYDRHLWQLSYYDRIVRTNHELERIRAYIDSNPARWQERQDAMRSSS